MENVYCHRRLPCEARNVPKTYDKNNFENILMDLLSDSTKAVSITQSLPDSKESGPKSQSDSQQGKEEIPQEICDMIKQLRREATENQRRRKMAVGKDHNKNQKLTDRKRSRADSFDTETTTHQPLLKKSGKKSYSQLTFDSEDDFF